MATEPSHSRHTVASLAAVPNSLAPHYRRFRVAERLLLTGHSHQAWPDRAERGQLRAFEDAAALVDTKWEAAFERSQRVQEGFAALLGDRDGHIALGASTHELVVRFLSALPLRQKPRLVTTDGEFHSIRRQLARLQEEGIEVTRIPARPVDALPERIAAAVAAGPDRTSAVLMSSVLFQTAAIVPGLDRVAHVCERHGVDLLIDAYHHLNVVPMDLRAAGLSNSFVVGGGYKYCQLGEGNCFLRVPPRCSLRPVVTGWFSEFSLLSDRATDGRVPYGEGPARFAGATYDPTSHYRAAEVFGFMRDEALTPSLMRDVSRHQIEQLAARFDELGLDPRVIDRDRSVDLAGVAGFLSLHAPRAGEVRDALLARGVWTDHRGEVLRLGPAPYLHDGQLADAVGLLGEAVHGLRPVP